MPRHDPVVLLPSLLHLQLTVNTGAVFGIGAGMRWGFVLISVIATGVIGWFFATSRAGAWWLQTALALVLGGAWGNLYDRILYAQVRDMLHLLPGWVLPLGLTWPGGVRDVYPLDLQPRRRRPRPRRRHAPHRPLARDGESNRRFRRLRRFRRSTTEANNQAGEGSKIVKMKNFVIDWNFQVVSGFVRSDYLPRSAFPRFVLRQIKICVICEICGCFARRLDQPADEHVACRVAAAFGVPLDADVKPTIGIVDGFDHLVRGGGEHPQPPRVGDRLVVMRHDM